MGASAPFKMPKPCKSPYCECDPGKCTAPGFYDARGDVMEEVAFKSEPNLIDLVAFYGEKSFVVRDKGYIKRGDIACKATDTGNGFIAKFPANSSVTQDYYVCLDYSQARDLVLALSPFKKALGFE